MLKIINKNRIFYIFPITIYVDGKKMGKISSVNKFLDIEAQEGYHDLKIEHVIPWFSSQEKIYIGNQLQNIEVKNNNDNYLIISVLFCLFVIVHVIFRLNIFPNWLLLSLIFVPLILGMIKGIFQRKTYFKIKH